MLGQPLKTSTETVAQWLAEYPSHATVQQRLAYATRESYALNARRIEPHVGHLRLSDLSATHTQSLYNVLLTTGISSNSVGQVCALLRKSVKTAVRRRLIYNNPCDSVDVPRGRARDIEPQTVDQVRQVFRATQHEELHPLWVTLVTTGLRIGEALGLKWEDIQWDEKRMTVRRSVQRQGDQGLVFKDAKTHRSRRWIHLADETVRVLRRCYLKQ